MIGIELNKENNYDRFINDLLNGIKFNEYKINILENEVMSEDIQNRFLNKYEILDMIKGKDKSKYYILFINLQIFSGEEKNTEIRTYKDFLDSSCEFILLINDGSFVEMYFKNNKIKNIILNNLKDMNIDYIVKTKENDNRYIMSVA